MKKFIFFPLLLIILTGCADYGVPQTYAVPKAPSAIESTLDTQKDVESITDAELETFLNSVVATQENKVQTPVKEEPSDVPLSNDNHYINVSGNTVHSPAYAPSQPSGASAKCKDGTYSFSQNRRGTCSHHGGVAMWY